MKRGLAITTAAVAFTASAQAATPIFWKPARMAAALVAAKYPDDRIVTAKCVGVGKKRPAGFASFRCSYVWTMTDGTHAETRPSSSTVYARPLRVGFCASTISLAACKPVTG